MICSATVAGLPLDQPKILEKYVETTLRTAKKDKTTLAIQLLDSLVKTGGMMTFWAGEFTISPSNGKIVGS